LIRCSIPPPPVEIPDSVTATITNLAVSGRTTWAQPTWRGIVRFRITLVALFLAVVATACVPATASRRASPAAVPTAAHHTKSVAAATTSPASPRQLRAQFEQLLGLHALLAVRQMRSAVRVAPDFVPVANASLLENTDALSRLVASVYGKAQGDRFKQLWQRHITDLFSYANGVASNDTSAARTARTALLADADSYGSWLAGASQGRVQASDAAAGVRMHVEELMQQLDAYATRDYGQAYRIEREAYEHMFTAGATLVKAAVTPELAVGLDTPPEKLRSGFAMLLGEHLELIIEAQRATFAGSAEFEAAAAQVNANTTALTRAMSAIVGPKKAAEFQAAWANHVDGLLAYTAAVARKDEAAKALAKKNLDAFAARLALYFSGVVRNRLAVEPLTDALTMHDTHLISHVEAYAAKNYPDALRTELDGYRQMLGVANTLVDAVQRTVKPGLPVGGSQTGGGGTAHCRR
jgi:hypothetical protein